jgi:hypothetical protein
MINWPKTQTAQDARDRMDVARSGSLAPSLDMASYGWLNPTVEYLGTLLNEIRDWERSVREELLAQHDIRA